MNEHMLSTVDNPFNPVTQFDEWNVWDQSAGYNTLAYLARVVVTSDELSPTLQSQAIEEAIDEVVSENNGLYIKVPVIDMPPRT
jgi:hypothetical protein